MQVYNGESAVELVANLCLDCTRFCVFSGECHNATRDAQGKPLEAMSG